MAKIDEAEYELLQNLFNFHQKKIGKSASIKELEDKFGESATKLVDSGDISFDTLKSFCEDEGITTPNPKPRVYNLGTFRPTESYGCGTSRSSYRSSC